MQYITPDHKISRRQWNAGLKKVLDHGTLDEARHYFKKTRPPFEMELNGVRYFSFNATIQDNICSRKRAYALARDPQHSFVTELGHTMLKVSSVLYDTD